MEAEENQSGTMIDDMCSNSGADEDSPRRKAICGGERLDIEAYGALYSGRTKITRLLFIADKCDNTEMQLEALRMAYEEIKKGSDTALFRYVVRKINGRLGPDYGLDHVWIDAVDLRAEKEEKRLENEFAAYVKSCIKESIRMGFTDFGDFYYSRGQLQDSLRCYSRTCDYSSTSKHIIHMCLNVILVSIEMGQFVHATTYASKAEQIQDALDPITMSKLSCAVGLAHLEAKEYKLAARKFLEVGQVLGKHYMEVIAPQDVATYGGLCALASFERAELKSKVLDNVNFKVFIELVPELREVIYGFYTCQYALCFEYLGSLKANLLLDIYLHGHVETLYSQIRNKALIQYTHPFVSVDLHIMSNAFKTTVSELEKELASMITNDHIKARIDSHNKILYARHADLRKTTFQKALQTGWGFDRDVRAMLLRANLVRLESSSLKQQQPIELQASRVYASRV